jgi:hypothetical protein
MGGDSLNWDFLGQVIPQVGMGSIFLYLFIKKSQEYREDIKAKDCEAKEVLGKKEKRIEDLSDKFTEIIKENTRVVEGVKNAIDNNTKVIETLTERVYDTLRGSKE